MISEKNGETLVFEVVNRCLTVRSGDLSAEFNAGSPRFLAKLPEIAPFEESRYFKLSAEALRRMIDRTVVAAKPKEFALFDVEIRMNFDLNCTQFIFGQNSATAAATDGRRLVVQRVATEYLSGTPNEEFQEKTVLFPSETLRIIRQFCSDATEAFIAFGARSDLFGDREFARIKIGNVVISTTTSPKSFPCWSSSFPKDLPTRNRVEIAASDFASAVFFLEGKEKNIREDMGSIEPAILRMSKGRLAIRRTSPAAKLFGEVEFPVRYDGAPSAFMLDIRYLVDIVRYLSPRETFRLYFSDKDMLAIFAADDGYRCAVLKIMGKTS